MFQQVITGEPGGPVDTELRTELQQKWPLRQMTRTRQKLLASSQWQQAEKSKQAGVGEPRRPYPRSYSCNAVA